MRYSIQGTVALCLRYLVDASWPDINGKTCTEDLRGI